VEPTALGTVAPRTIFDSVVVLMEYVLCGLVGVAGIHGTVRTVSPDADASCATHSVAKDAIAMLEKNRLFICQFLIKFLRY
jgi:hypothetical protein